ncbi:hypothetical protein FDA94_17085 [Herbidospora galbida]|uniref:DUF4360 domain-containing protein n=1 Tax=Herbidospora galbida TaxID=2575442 RepID=A0A4U3MFL8_9ACTN|nr:hypothetical protein [Herbidospora galbida]TKK87540.1 hypothetical protein FDA94_17085 [Herbidospora galbida]
MKRSMPWAILLLIAACTSAPLTAPAPCPETWTGKAPEETTVDGAADMLVPGTPAGALMCAYPGDNMTDGEALGGQRRLTADQTTRMASDLNRLPAGTGSGACTLAGGPETNYLVRVDYAGGERVWLTTGDEVNSCTDTANGSFTTDAYLGEEMTVAYRTGKWTTPQREDPCHRSLGRRGQEFDMVPGRPVGVLVCGEDSQRDHGRDVALALADDLNAIPARPGRGSCTGTSTETYHLQFRYSEGPGVGVTVRVGCRPPVHNGSLDGTGEFPRLKALSQGG